jgi:hypothetical protein
LKDSHEISLEVGLPVASISSEEHLAFASDSDLEVAWALGLFYLKTPDELDLESARQSPMYAHLGRDPYPARLMQQRAPAVYRWVERMNREDQDAPEYFNAGNDFLVNDEVPETLIPVLKILAEDFVPETLAAANLINHWLAEHQPEPGAIAVGRLAEALGTADFTVRGETITALAQPHRFFLLQRVQDAFVDLSDKERGEVNALLKKCGMERLLTAALSRRILRSDNLEIWGRRH